MNDENLETIIDKIRLPKSHARLIRDLIALGLIFVGLAIFLGLFGGAQYFICYVSDQNTTVKQCFKR